jgi:hypothetical protein
MATTGGYVALQAGAPTVANTVAKTIASHRHETTSWNIGPERGHDWTVLARAGRYPGSP